jgi:hypothetical protein
MTTITTTYGRQSINFKPVPHTDSRATSALLRKTLVRLGQMVLLFAIMFATMNAIFVEIDQQVCSQPGAMQNAALHCEEVVMNDVQP